MKVHLLPLVVRALHCVSSVELVVEEDVEGAGLQVAVFEAVRVEELREEREPEELIRRCSLQYFSPCATTRLQNWLVLAVFA